MIILYWAINKLFTFKDEVTLISCNVFNHCLPLYKIRYFNCRYYFNSIRIISALMNINKIILKSKHPINLIRGRSGNEEKLVRYFREESVYIPHHLEEPYESRRLRTVL